jgi:cytochrome c biogenesis protein CcmG/thiol:disulfide interchange protein DsbE
MSTNVHAPSPARARAELRGSPAPLAALHAQSGRLLSGSAGGFHARLRALRGYPVVVNAWASWCVPCRQEFPIFGVASAAIGRRVAFLGLNDLDQMPGAQKFLAAHPVSYPSYEDGNGSLLRSINPVVGLPATVFYSRRGEVTYFHPGPYRSVSELLGDIRRYGEGERVAVKTSIAPKAFEGATLPPNFRVPRFSLKDQFGRPATSDQYAGRPFVLTFMHSHCHDTCPLMAQDIRGVGCLCSRSASIPRTTRRPRRAPSSPATTSAA